MSFLKNVQAKYGNSGVIKTDEPIKITYKLADDLLIVSVDGIEYVVIKDVSSEDDIDLKKVGEWVEDTYYDEDYKSSMYVPPRLSCKEFAK